MTAISRESYRDAQAQLARYARGAEPEAIVGVADEILAFAEVLRRQHRLRRALAAPTRSGTDRVGLLRSLVADRVGADTAELLAALVEGRWSRPTDLLDATERLGVDALLATAERAGELSTVEDELFRFGRIARGDTRLASVLGDVTVDPQRRLTLVRELLTGKARPVTVRLAETALAGFGGRTFAGAVTRLVELVAERRELTVAYVTSAVPLQPDQERRLAEAFAARYGQQVSLKLDVDPQLLGGVKVRVGSELYDGTVRRRLAEARLAMTR